MERVQDDVEIETEGQSDAFAVSSVHLTDTLDYG